jgi:hypothetical protein
MDDLEVTALAVLDAEMAYTDAVALREDATSALVALQAAQAAYEAAVLARTNAWVTPH